MILVTYFNPHTIYTLHKTFPTLIPYPLQFIIKKSLNHRYEDEIQHFSDVIYKKTQEIPDRITRITQ